MVKLRGINVYPQGIGALKSAVFHVTTGEYICRVARTNGRDEKTVVLEVTERNDALKDAIEFHLRTRLGVGISVQLLDLGETAVATGIETWQKPIRLIDES